MSNNLICIIHPNYHGDHAPQLSCKTCCHIYLEKIKSKNSKKFDAKKWIKDKKEEIKNNRHTNFYFDSSLI